MGRVSVGATFQLGGKFGVGRSGGIEWDELTIPYGDPRNSENAMVDAPDRYRYILEALEHEVGGAGRVLRLSKKLSTLSGVCWRAKP
jgi:hypothetical protein